jgi:hypothetical protein
MQLYLLKHVRKFHASVQLMQILFTEAFITRFLTKAEIEEGYEKIYRQSDN